MTTASYRNQKHYVTEGWSTEPKEIFKSLRTIIERKRGLSGLNFLDVGCATGELIGYLARCTAKSHFTGVDVSGDLLSEARRLAPFAEFRNASALDLPVDFSGAFDVVCALGVMSIFNESEIEAFWDNLLRVTKPGGLVVVLSPLNEYGVDAIIRHRKRIEGHLGEWETGWNIFSIETVQEIIAKRNASLELEIFNLPFDLPRKPDPIRTWTMATQARPRQLTNGVKLLVDHYFMIVETGK